ncbi:MAG: hypothetical protein HYW10_04245, partial [Candidatus Omnitrophica bacterium]|nr:hypothetical protein [Candidatus Omnitrophota bacterium]
MSRAAQIGRWLIAAGLLVSRATQAAEGPSLPSPTATLLGNGQAGQVTVPVGSAVTMTWQAQHAASATSSYTVSPAESCPGQTGTGPWPWIATTLQGSVTLTALPCHAGHAYTLTYTATNPAGQSATATLVAVVPPVPPPAAPVPTATLLGNGQAGQVTVPVGSAVTMTWQAQHAASATSSYTVSPAES